MQVLRNLRTIRRQMRECRDDVARFAPDALIPDRLPRIQHADGRVGPCAGIRVFYYIAPKVWAWREYRVKAMRRCIDRLFVIFPFERGYFRSKGIEPVFEGNPLVDAIAARCAALPPSQREFRRRHGPRRSADRGPAGRQPPGRDPRQPAAHGRPVEALPRPSVRRCGVSWLDRALYERYAAGSDIRYVCDETYETLRARPRPPW